MFIMGQLWYATVFHGPPFPSPRLITLQSILLLLLLKAVAAAA